MWLWLANSQELHKNQISLANTTHITDVLKGQYLPCYACYFFESPGFQLPTCLQWLGICSLPLSRVSFNYFPSINLSFHHYHSDCPHKAPLSWDSQPFQEHPWALSSFYLCSRHSFHREWPSSENLTIYPSVSSSKVSSLWFSLELSESISSFSFTHFFNKQLRSTCGMPGIVLDHSRSNHTEQNKNPAFLELHIPLEEDRCHTKFKN